MEAIKSVYTFTLGTSPIAQLIQIVLITFVSYVVMISAKSLLDALIIYSEATVDLLPKQYNSAKVIHQDPNNVNSKTILPSVNAPSGLEFSYSCYLYISDKTFETASNGLKHIFHKGSSQYKPLLCPGVFMKSSDNTLVVYMNEVDSWKSNCEIKGFPVNKWVHLVIVVRNMNVDIFVNGNIAQRMVLDSIPKQNYGDVYVFKNQKFIENAGADTFKVLGAASGNISRLKYTAYALNYEQIDRLMRQGPSTQVDSSDMDSISPPYLADSWWVTS
jgi:hypothetical protein